MPCSRMASTASSAFARKGSGRPGRRGKPARAHDSASPPPCSHLPRSHLAKASTLPGRCCGSLAANQSEAAGSHPNHPCPSLIVLHCPPTATTSPPPLRLFPWAHKSFTTIDYSPSDIGSDPDSLPSDEGLLTDSESLSDPDWSDPSDRYWCPSTCTMYSPGSPPFMI